MAATHLKETLLDWLLMAKGVKTGGRQPGSLNKVTVEFKATVQALLDENRHNVSLWLQRVAEGDKKNEVKPDPGKALDLLAKLAEYAAPKLNRTEVMGEGGGPVRHAVEMHIVDTNGDKG